MPAKVAILYPSIAMALLSLTLLLSLGVRRFLAVRQRQVNFKYYQTFDTADGEPVRLRQHSRNVNNQFEVPPLFHLAVWGTYVAGEVTSAAVFAGWLFVISRVVHSAIHLTYNTVLHRFSAYGIGVLATLFLWIRLLGGLHA